ncbi:MAG: hypothetical protein JNM10_18580 [Planctomycetia bacterium]|nr:hypothetical protein [Planctomycetia bacterium]
MGPRLRALPRLVAVCGAAGLACLAAGLALRAATAADAPPGAPRADAPRITVTAVTTDGTPVRDGVVALQQGDDEGRFTDVTTLSLNGEGKQSFPRPSAGTWRARLVSGGDFAATQAPTAPDRDPTDVVSPAESVTDADAGPTLRIVAPVAGALRVRVPATISGGTFVLRRPMPPYAWAPLPTSLDRIDERADAAPEGGTVVRWRGVPPGRWQVLLRSRDAVVVAAEAEVRAGTITDLTLPAPPPGTAAPTLDTLDPAVRDRRPVLDRWDDAPCPDHTPLSWTREWDNSAPIRPGAYVLHFSGLDSAMILRHDGAPRGLRLAPPPAPTVGGVTVRVRVVADGLDVRRVFVGLASGDAALADGTWIRTARHGRLDHVPPGRHTLVVLDGVDLHVVGLPGGAHTQPLDVGATDVTTTVVLR